MIKSNLRVLLAMNELTQTKLTKLTGIRPGTITNIVNNQCKQLPVEAIDKICDVLNCDVGDLFTHIKSSNIETQQSKSSD